MASFDLSEALRLEHVVCHHDEVMAEMKDSVQAEEGHVGNEGDDTDAESKLGIDIGIYQLLK